MENLTICCHCEEEFDENDGYTCCTCGVYLCKECTNEINDGIFGAVYCEGCIERDFMSKQKNNIISLEGNSGYTSFKLTKPEDLAYAMDWFCDSSAVKDCKDVNELLEKVNFLGNVSKLKNLGGVIKGLKSFVGKNHSKETRIAHIINDLDGCKEVFKEEEPRFRFEYMAYKKTDTGVNFIYQRENSTLVVTGKVCIYDISKIEENEKTLTRIINEQGYKAWKEFICKQIGMNISSYGSRAKIDSNNYKGFANEKDICISVTEYDIFKERVAENNFKDINEIKCKINEIINGFSYANIDICIKGKTKHIKIEHMSQILRNSGGQMLIIKDNINSEYGTIFWVKDIKSIY